MYKIPANEQETVIQIDRVGKMANVWTSDQVMMRKLDKFVENPDSPWEIVETCYFNEGGVREVSTKEYQVTKNMISFRSKSLKLSPEESKKRAEFFQRYRENETQQDSEDN